MMFRTIWHIKVIHLLAHCNGFVLLLTRAMVYFPNRIEKNYKLCCVAGVTSGNQSRNEIDR